MGGVGLAVAAALTLGALAGAWGLGVACAWTMVTTAAAPPRAWASGALAAGGVAAVGQVAVASAQAHAVGVWAGVAAVTAAGLAAWWWARPRTRGRRA